MVAIDQVDEDGDGDGDNDASRLPSVANNTSQLDGGTQPRLEIDGATQNKGKPRVLNGKGTGMGKSYRY
ncbi:hypothetical protein V6N11_018610 [Hibiscus sabdariffa]|uniref:Uncharacterized protein n=1 Tax=Hibiscus sabdariffa TaxID=183260 RepID=A0ABR2N8M0_9ROSI